MNGDMNGDILDPDGARARLAAWKGRIDKLAADTKSMSDQLQDLRVTAADANGLTEVTVDATGMLLELRLTDRIHHTDPNVVARTIMGTIRDARTRIADRSQEIIAETVGTESPAARAIAESVDRQLRVRTDDDVPEVAPDDDDDDGFDVRDDLRR
jgi:DNA-binding protein YbaB